jgi:serine/threonine protein kinase
MSLPSGTRFGPYEITAPLGAGGMGEVYRARDTRLSRDVAIKTLPAAFATDPERRARFESEARAIAALSHPNVLALHDVGTAGDIAYAVMELVEGQTLRERLIDGPISSARMIALAIQIAQGLAAAHDKGIVHRDLKPENLIITPDGRVKILDFGLARRETPVTANSQSLAPTVAVATEPGAVMGTTAYMSPEQVRGQVADARSDIFALGAVMYEMISGVRPFGGETAAETMTAILREQQADLAQRSPDVSPALERIVKRCLEKQPQERFRSAADLAFALEAISTVSSAAHAALSSSNAIARGRPRFKRITFRNGMVASARFMPDGSGVVFGASWDGKPFEIFTAHAGSPEARSLGLPAGNILSISSTGEMAISLGYAHDFWNQAKGTLARNALSGGGIRPMQKAVGHADWSPDGKTLALVVTSKAGAVSSIHPATCCSRRPTG